MSKVYSRIRHLHGDFWFLGIIDNHQARTLTVEEIDAVIEKLNAKEVVSAPRDTSDMRRVFEDLRREMGRISITGDIQSRDTRQVADALCVILDHLRGEL